jgi:hypothetical protein
MDWHGPRPTKIKTIQLRREISKPLEHQYVVLILSDDCILRLDRRGDEANPAHPVTSHGIEFKDTIANVDSLPDLDNTSYCLVKLYCQDSDVDLSNIIKICFGIHRDNEVGRYTPQYFNGYFFAWTIVVVTARHAAPWDTHPSDSPWQMLSQALADTLSTKFADALINMMVHGGVTIIMEIHSKLKRELSRAMSRRARLAWAMPQWLIRLTLRIMIITAWKPKIYKSLRSKLQSTLLAALELTLHSTLEDLRVSKLRTILWKDDVGGAMRHGAHPKVMAAILDAVTKALSSIRLRREDADAFQSLAETFVHRDFLEGREGHWGAAGIEGFNAIMQAAPRFAAGGANDVITDNTKWDEVWGSIRESVQDASIKTMKGKQVGRWVTLRDALMKEWDTGWDAIGHEIRDALRVTINEMVNLVNDELTDYVVDTLPDTHLHIGVTNIVSFPKLG